MNDLIIVGGGPAGLTAAIYAIRKRLQVLLISPDLGGKTNAHLTIPQMDMHSVINGKDIVDEFRREIEYLEFAHLIDGVQHIDAVDAGYAVTTTHGKHFESKALLIATGARAQPLNVPGEKEFMMRGVCYSAISYAPLFLGKRVAVIGDRPHALQAAAELSYIASEVTLIAPKHIPFDTPLAHKLHDSARVNILDGYRVREIKGNLFARSVIAGKNGDVSEVDIDAVFIELELIGCSDLVAHLVERAEHGRILVDAMNRTSRPGIFAAGDVTNVHAEQVLVAIGEGAKAALSAYEYILST